MALTVLDIKTLNIKKIDTAVGKIDYSIDYVDRFPCVGEDPHRHFDHKGARIADLYYNFGCRFYAIPTNLMIQIPETYGATSVRWGEVWEQFIACVSRNFGDAKILQYPLRVIEHRAKLDHCFVAALKVSATGL